MLGIYFDEAHNNKLSEGDGSNPDITIVNGETGGSEERKLFIWNDNAANKTYENVRITAKNSDADFKVEYAFDEGGAPGTFSSAITLPNGDFANSVPFWRKVTIAPQDDSITRRDIKHKLTADEFAK